MRLSAATALLALSAISSAATAECKHESYGTIPIELTDQGGVLVPALVQGKVGWVGLDLTLGFSMIESAAAKHLGLAATPITGSKIYVGDQAIALQVKVPSVRIGNMNFTNWKFGVNPNSPKELEVRAHGVPFIGRIGTRLLGEVDIELNLPKRRIALHKPVECGAEAVYWGGEVTSLAFSVDSLGVIQFPMEIDGQLVYTALNTVSAASSISEKVTQKFFGFNRSSEGIFRDPDSPGGASPVYRAMSLTASGLQVHNIRVRLRDDRKYYCPPFREGGNNGPIGFGDCVQSTAATLGTEVLRKLRVYIANREKRIYFTIGDPANSQATQRDTP